MDLTPGQATYILTRLINEKRISHHDLTTYLHDLSEEISSIEARLAILHPLRTTQTRRTPSNSLASKPTTLTTPSNSIASNTTPPQRHLSPAVRAARRIQGRYVGYIRQIPARQRATFQRIAKTKGFPAAIAALRKHLKK